MALSNLYILKTRGSKKSISIVQSVYCCDLYWGLGGDFQQEEKKSVSISYTILPSVATLLNDWLEQKEQMLQNKEHTVCECVYVHVCMVIFYSIQMKTHRICNLGTLFNTRYPKVIIFRMSPSKRSSI